MKPLVHVGYALCGCMYWACYGPSEEDIRKQLDTGADVRIMYGRVEMGDCPHSPKWGKA